MLKSTINAAKEKISEYLQLQVESFRLIALERVAGIGGTLVFLTLVFIFFLAGIFFICFGIAETMSVWLKSKPYGYFATAGIMFFVAVIIGALKKPVKRMIGSALINIITDEDNEPKATKRIEQSSEN